MNWISALNNALEYMENNLENEDYITEIWIPVVKEEEKQKRYTDNRAESY
ncbi:MAG: hypothetical protein LBV03_08115 [Fusobacteriales bacterium]|jgi:hypothetical protein|nr:hypothetical protein [Fusobacteriales bacterium]